MFGRTIFKFLISALLASVLASISVAQYYPNNSPIPTSATDSYCPSAAKTGKLDGKWVRGLQVRELQTYAIAATVTGDELKICLSQTVGDAKLGVTLTAEYTLSKEGLVHGIITGADLIQDPKATKSILSEGELGDLVRGLQNLVDCPFSFRTRITSEGLMVSNVKLAIEEKDLKGFEVTKEILALLGGMYKPSNDGNLPMTKTRDAATGTSIAKGQGQTTHPIDKDFVEQYYKTEFDTTDHQAPPASPPPPAQAPAKVLDMDRPARMVTLKECIAIALSIGSLTPTDQGIKTPTELGSKLEILNVQPGTGILNQRIELDIQINYLLANTEVAYWNLFAAYHNLYAQEEGLRQAFQSYRFTDTRATVGSEPSCNRDQARAQFERFRRLVIDARGQVLESERQLRGLLGLRNDDGKRLVPSDEPSISLNTLNFEEAAKEAMANRPEVLQCRQDLKVKQLNLILQKNLQRPDLRIVIGYSVVGLSTPDATQCVDEAKKAHSNAFEQLADNQFQNWTTGLRLTMPPGFRDANAQVREAQLSMARSYYQLRGTELKVMEYLVQQYRQVIQTHADIAPARAEREALQNYIAKMSALISDGKYKSDDFLNHLTVRQELATAISTEYQAIANYRNALATFEFAKGTIQRYNDVCIAKDPLPTKAEMEDAIQSKEVTAPVEKTGAIPGSLAHAPIAGALLRAALGEGSASTAPQLTFSYLVPDRVIAPEPREVSTLRLRLVVPTMTAPSLPPMEFPVELPH